jgi:uncharacterized RDD family membrane protein YckC
MNASLTIRTPEGIVFSHALAGPVTRSMAVVVDLACVGVISSAFGAVGALAGVLSVDLARAFAVLAYFIVGIGYGVATEWYWRGQTVGKRLLRLRVIDQQGLRLHFGQILIRNLLRFVDVLPLFYAVGGVACLLSRRSQRLGDVAAGTLVIRMPRISSPDLNQVTAGKFNSLRQHPHLEARLRQRISPQEAAVYLQAVLRRDQFDPAQRVKLFSELAGYLKSAVTFPAEDVDALTDEQYVRNVVDILYRSRGENSGEAARATRPA